MISEDLAREVHNLSCGLVDYDCAAMRMATVEELFIYLFEHIPSDELIR